MRSLSIDGGATLRKNLLLAPTSIAPASMLDMVVDSKSHGDRMFEAQQLRGRIALREGAVDPTQLLADGRHVQAADHQSWHLLTLDAEGRVAEVDSIDRRIIR